MKIFLMVVGGIVVGLILFVIVAIIALRFFIMSKLGKFREQMEKMVGAMNTAFVPPFRMNLKPLPAGRFDNPIAQTMTGVLEERGFTSAGDFVAHPMQAELKIRLLANPEQGLRAAIYEHPQAGVWLDIVTRYTDGRAVTDSSARDSLMDPMPGKTIHYHEGADASAIYEVHLATRPVGDLEKCKTDELLELFEKVYTEEMEWRGTRGGPTDEEIRRICARDDNDATDETVQVIQDAWRTQFHLHRVETLRESFRDGGTVKAREWDTISGRLLFVYDGMPVASLDESVGIIVDCMNSTDDEEEDNGEEDDDKRSRQAMELTEQVSAVGARQAFAKHCRDYLGKKGFKLYATIDKPIAADVYVMPVWDNEDDE